MQSLWTTHRATRARWARVIALHHPNTTRMNQPLLLTPEYTVNVESFFGLTDWVTVKERVPPYVGWWKTRRLGCLGLLQPQRRWWSGKTFSMPVTPDMDDEEAEEWAREPAQCHLSAIEWCGLKHPHPTPYPYRLITL